MPCAGFELYPERAPRKRDAGIDVIRMFTALDRRAYTSRDTRRVATVGREGEAICSSGVGGETREVGVGARLRLRWRVSRALFGFGADSLDSNNHTITPTTATTTTTEPSLFFAGGFLNFDFHLFPTFFLLWTLLIFTRGC